jgi:lysophospholipase L1-like esterase
MAVLILATVLIAFVLIEVLWLKYYGSPVPAPDISRSVQTLGSGPRLRYVVMGDSTAVSQGSAYDEGYATATAAYLAKSHTVEWSNVAVPGARARDVLDKQLPQAAARRPDVVLIAVGANDVTHLSNNAAVRQALAVTITRLQKANSGVHIVLTGAPDMGAPPRLPQPLRWLAGRRTVSLNNTLQSLMPPPAVVFAPIAAKTGPVFRAHPDLFAADKFHPTAAGYRLWTPVLIDALQRAGF